MLSLFLFLSFLFSGHPGIDTQSSPSLESGQAHPERGGTSSTATSCEEIFARAVSLNESYKNAVSAAGQRVLELETERYFNTVLRKNIPGCVVYASAHPDADLSRLLFELAYSYASTTDDLISLELARFYSGNQEATKSILLNYEASKRRELIEILKRGLDTLNSRRPEDAPSVDKLKQRLNGLEPK